MSTTASAIDAREHLISYLENIAEMYVRDLEALPTDKVSVSPMGVARTPLEFTAECAGYNSIAADIVLGNEVEMPSEQARQEFYASVDTCEKAVALIRASVERLIGAIRDATENDLAKATVAPWGEPMTAFRLAHIAASHMSYHDGQLNYIQALYGDPEMHWH